MLFNDIMQRNHGRLQLFDELKLNTFSDVKVCGINSQFCFIALFTC